MTVFDTTIGDNFVLHHGDAIEVARSLPDRSVALTVSSWPFGDQYSYSNNIRDMGNVDSDEEMLEQCAFLVEQLFRATLPGRLTAVHCKDRQRYKSRFGKTGLWDFPGEIIRLHEALGWQYHSRFTIWKDPVLEQARTHTQRLTHKQVCADSSHSGSGQAEYLVVFRKWAKGQEEEEERIPVTRGRATVRFNSYAGSDAPQRHYINTRGRSAETDYSIQVWQRYASPVWMDIRQTKVLNVALARENEDEKHLCPLQLDVIERAIELWSNPGEIVLDPFAGVGSVPYQALKMGRRAVGSELKKSYYSQAAAYCRQVEDELRQPNLFSGLERAG